jgi:cellulose biosynthesis protein BcsQ
VKIVAFFNNKGGVGKTTLVYHLAWMFSRKKIKTLAVDLDPQAQSDRYVFAGKTIRGNLARW